MLALLFWLFFPVLIVILLSLGIWAFCSGVHILRVINCAGTVSPILQIFIGIHFCEPLVSLIIIIISFKYFPVQSLGLTPSDAFMYAWRLTMPILILLLPILGIFFQSVNERSLCFMLVWRGGVRWLLVFATFWASAVPSISDKGIDLLLGISGCAFLIWCVQSIKLRLLHTLS